MTIPRTLVAAVAAAAALALPVVGASARPTHAQPRVVNGRDVDASAFAARWSAIAAVTSTTSWGSTLCGGVVLDARTVVTAAHCTFNPNGTPISPGSVRVYVGRRVASSTEGDQVGVSTITRHPSFSRLTMRNDIAVLRLSRAPSVVVGTLQPTSLADEAWWGAGRGHAVGDALVGPFIAGWGATDADASRFPDTLQEAALPIASDIACSSSTAPGQGSTYDPSTMLCAGATSTTRGNGIDACQGDSGGPLVVGNGAGDWRLVGLTSWGRDCGGTYYGVYTRVGRFVEWLEPLRWVPSEDPPVQTSPPKLVPDPEPVPQPVPGPDPDLDADADAGPGTTVQDHAAEPAGRRPAAPAATAIGPLVTSTNLRPTAPSRLHLRLVGQRAVPVLRWRASRDDGRVVRYRVREWRARAGRVIASTRAATVVLRRLGPGVHVLRVQAIDDRGLASRPSRAVHVVRKIGSSSRRRTIGLVVPWWHGPRAPNRSWSTMGALTSAPGCCCSAAGPTVAASPPAGGAAPVGTPPPPGTSAQTTRGGGAGTAASQAKQGVLMIGDSLTVGTKQYMPSKVGDAKVTIDATGGIPLKEGMRRYDAVKEKPRVVEMALFTNDTPDHVGELRSAIEKTVKDARARGGKVVWATIHGVKKWGSYDQVNAMIRDYAAKNPDVMGLVDWEKMVQQHPGYLAGDGIHGTAAGYKARAAAFTDAAR
jgi:secreted trypsin-like serine protease